jgi:hypothetical protein
MAPEMVVIPRYPISDSSPSLLDLSQREANDAMEIFRLPKQIKSHVD